jgi:hypothetical protein
MALQVGDISHRVYLNPRQLCLTRVVVLPAPKPRGTWVLLLPCRMVGVRELPCLAEAGKKETEVMPR